MWDPKAKETAGCGDPRPPHQGQGDGGACPQVSLWPLLFLVAWLWPLSPLGICPVSGWVSIATPRAPGVPADPLLTASALCTPQPRTGPGTTWDPAESVGPTPWRGTDASAQDPGCTLPQALQLPHSLLGLRFPSTDSGPGGEAPTPQGAPLGPHPPLGCALQFEATLGGHLRKPRTLSYRQGAVMRHFWVAVTPHLPHPLSSNPGLDSPSFLSIVGTPASPPWEGGRT